MLDMDVKRKIVTYPVNNVVHYRFLLNTVIKIVQLIIYFFMNKEYK